MISASLVPVRKCLSFLIYFMEEKIFEKYIKGQCSEDEMDEFTKWLNNDGDTRSLNSYIWSRKYWNRLDTKAEISELSESGSLDRISLNKGSVVSGLKSSSAHKYLIHCSVRTNINFSI